MVTMGDVAELAGVSKMTVSNVVNNRPGVSEAVRRRVLEAIRQSGYRLNVSARSLRSGRTGVIGLAVPEIDRPYFGLLAGHVVEQAGLRGFHVAIEETGADLAGEIDAITRSRTLQFDGLILSSVELDPGDRGPADAGYPIVMLGEQEYGGRLDHVAMPNEEGTKAATCHLIDRGCRRIAIVTGTGLEGVNVVSRRYHGYLDALAERGLEPDPRLHFPIPEMTMEAGRAAAHQLAAGAAGAVRPDEAARAGAVRPDEAARAGTVRAAGGDAVPIDGVVAVTDTVAMGVLRGLADRGLRVPGDVRVVGFDDIPEAAFLTPSLSTVAPDHAWMAAKAVKLLLGRLDRPDRPPLQCVAPYELVVRESTG